MEFLKMLKALLAKGFATSAEKVEMKTLLKAQDEDVQEVAADNVEAVEALPEENPEDGEVVEEVEKAIKQVFASEKAGISESIQKGILTEVQKLIDEHTAKQEKGVGVYSTEVQKDVKRKAANNFLREGLLCVLNGGETKEFTVAQKEMTTDDSASPYAGFITDDFLSAEIRHLQTTYGVAASEFETVTFMQSSYKANNLATDVSVFWVDEAGSIKSTQAVLGQETLNLNKLAAIVTITRELLQEQEIDFISFLGERVAEAFAQAEDDAFFNGDGTSAYGSFTGLLENTDVNIIGMDTGDTTFQDLTVEYLREMQDGTPQGALANGKYFMHRSVKTIVRNLREDAVTAGDGAGAFIYQINDKVATIDGYPVVEVEVMPTSTDTAISTPFILFGDVRKATIRGVRGGIIADRFNAGSVRNVANDADINLITTDREAVRWISQVGYIVIIPTAVTKLVTAAA